MNGQPFAGRIVTQRYNVGPYTFYSSLPTIGTSADKNEWNADINGKFIDARFETLEAAMIAAINGRGE